MKFELMSYIYSNNVYVFIEFDLKDIKTDWENPYAITFDRYNNKYFNLLDNTLQSIGEKERPFTMNEVEKRLDSNHTLFIAKKDDKIIGFFWVATKHIEIPYIHASIRFNEEELFDYNSYIVKEYRGKNINKGLKIYAFHNLKQKGYKRVFGCINATNKNSLRSNEYLGFRTIGKIREIIIMTLEFRYHNFSTAKIVFHGGILRIWKRLFKKVKEKHYHKRKLLH